MKSRSIRILHVLPKLGPGGAERIVADLIRWQTRQKDESSLSVLGPRNEDSELPYGLSNVPHFGFSGSYCDLRAMRDVSQKLQQHVDQIRPDIIHAHLWPAAPFAARAAAQARIPCIVHIHDARPWLASGELRYRVQRLMHRRILGSTKAVLIAVCEAVKQYTAAQLPWQADAIRVIHNGIDVERFNPGNRRDHQRIVTIGSAGRLEVEKGFDDLLDAASELHRKAIPFRLRIAGDGPFRSHLLGSVNDLGLNEMIELVGPVADMRAFYEQLDVFVLPSLTEGLPLSVMEAMASGLPVVATNVGGLAELVREKQDGLLVPASNPPALASALSTVVQDGALRAQMGQHGRERVESRFTTTQMAEKVRSVYEELVSGSHVYVRSS